MPSPRRSACLARSRASTRTRFRSCSRSITTSSCRIRTRYDQILFASVKQAFDMGASASARPSTSAPRNRIGRFRKSRHAFQAAHELGMVTILWCYLRNNAFKTKDKDYHASADLTGQGNHLGVTIGADIIKQKLPDQQRRLQGAPPRKSFGKTHDKVYTELTQRSTRST